MGNIVNTLQLCKTTRSLAPVFNYYTTQEALVSRSSNMRRAVRAWESSSGTHSNSHKRKVTQHLHRRWPGRMNSYNKSLATYRSKSRKATRHGRICKNRTRTPSQQAIINRRKLHDAKDNLLKKFKIAARDSPSSRCNDWVKNIPPSSTWIKEHTLSGHDIMKTCLKKSKQTPSQSCKKRQNRPRTTEKLSQRSILMKRLMDTKLNKLKTHVAKKKTKHLKKRVKQHKKRINPKASAGKFDVKKLKETELSGSASEDSYEMRRKAAQVVRKVWSQPLKSKKHKCSKIKQNKTSEINASKPTLTSSKKYKMWAVEQAHKAHKKNLMKVGYQSLQKRAENIEKAKSEHPCRKNLKLTESLMHRKKSSFTKVKRKKRSERKLKKIRHWMKEKTEKRPKCKMSKKVYVRKHRPGLFISREKKKPSLAWAILQSIKLLEPKGIPYPLAILKNVQTKWGQKEITLVELNDALKWMVKKGILKSNPTRDRESAAYSITEKHKTKKLKKKVSFKHDKNFKSDDSETDMDRDGKIAIERGLPRLRFQHGKKEFTSVKCKKYGSHRDNM